MVSSSYIISDDSIHAIGLKYLIDKYFNIPVQILSPEELQKIADSNSLIFFISTQIYIENLEFFYSRRNRIIIIQNKTTPDYKFINTTDTESEIIEQISSLISSIESNTEHQIPNELSQREIEILKLIAMGHLNKEIASILSISINTVLTHRKNITSKLGIRSVSGLGIYATINGYISEKDLKR